MSKVKRFAEFINERETSEYEPPKYLISPALGPDGKPNDKMHSYMEDELKKRKTYFSPGVKSANPPKDTDIETHTNKD